MSVIASAAAWDEALFRRTLDALPAAAYTCDGTGLITYFNTHAQDVWGRAPALNDPVDRFCGSFRLLGADNALISHDDCWMAMAIRNRREYLAQKITVERQDHSRVAVLAYATPVLDAEGNVVSAVNLLVNISEQARLEALLVKANQTNDFYRAALAEALRDQLAPMSETLSAMGHFLPSCPGLAESISQLRMQVAQLSDLVDHMVDVDTPGRVRNAGDPASEPSTVHSMGIPQP